MSSSARSAFVQVVHVCRHLRQVPMAAATVAVPSGTPVWTVSRISGVSVRSTPRMECSPGALPGCLASASASITRVNRALRLTQPSVAERIG